MSHTPGEWRACPHNSAMLVRDSQNRIICTRYRLPKVESDANAHLIAAAPDLLASLRKAIAVIEDLYKWEPIQAQHEETGVEWKGIRMDKPERYVEFSNQAGVPPEDMNPILDGLRAAIAKATSTATQERQKGEG